MQNILPDILVLEAEFAIPSSEVPDNVIAKVFIDLISDGGWLSLPAQRSESKLNVLIVKGVPQALSFYSILPVWKAIVFVFPATSCLRKIRKEEVVGPLVNMLFIYYRF